MCFGRTNKGWRSSPPSLAEVYAFLIVGTPFDDNSRRMPNVNLAETLSCRNSEPFAIQKSTPPSRRAPDGATPSLSHRHNDSQQQPTEDTLTTSVVRKTIQRLDGMCVNGRPQANGLPLHFEFEPSDEAVVTFALDGETDRALELLFEDWTEPVLAWVRIPAVWRRLSVTIAAAAISDCVDLVTEILQHVGAHIFVELCLTPLDLPQPPHLGVAKKNRYTAAAKDMAKSNRITPAHFMASTGNRAVFRRFLLACVEADKTPLHFVPEEFKGEVLPFVPFDRRFVPRNNGQPRQHCSLSLIRLITAPTRDAGTTVVRALIATGQFEQLKWILEAVNALQGPPPAWLADCFQAVRAEMLNIAAECNALDALHVVHAFGEIQTEKLNCAFTTAVNSNAKEAVRLLHSWGGRLNANAVIDRVGPAMTELLISLGVHLEPKMCVAPPSLIRELVAAAAASTAAAANPPPPVVIAA